MNSFNASVIACATPARIVNGLGCYDPIGPGFADPFKRAKAIGTAEDEAEAVCMVASDMICPFDLTHFVGQ